jgi:serine/threonine-protein kinase
VHETAPIEPLPDAEVAPGQILAEKYRVERVLGRGGMGVVVEAQHLVLRERVALKFLLSGYAMQPDAAGRFLREAQAAAKIKSLHVARVSDVGTLPGGAPYMVMEFLEGQDLCQLVKTRGALAFEDAIDFVIQGCEAIAEAHAHGIIHRDIKPANLFLTRHPDGTPLIKVLDFGISKFKGEGADDLTRTKAMMGSALYMSPEQMQQTRSVDHRTDIYALGITLYELLSATQPFRADTLPQLCMAVCTGQPTPLREVRPDVPPALAEVIATAYRRDPDYRYPTVAAFVLALAPFAPRRCQPTIERIARLGGVSPHLEPAVPPAPPTVTEVWTPALGPSVQPTGLPFAPAGSAVPGRISTAAGMSFGMPPPAPKKTLGLWLALGGGLTLVAALVGGWVFLEKAGSPDTAAATAPEGEPSTAEPNDADSSGAVPAPPSAEPSPPAQPSSEQPAPSAPSAPRTATAAPKQPPRTDKKDPSSVIWGY